MDPLLLISGLVFLFVLLVGWGVVSYTQSKRTLNDWNSRVKGESLSQAKAKKTDTKDALKTQFVDLLERLGKLNSPKQQVSTSQLRSNLTTAGYRSNQAPIIFLGSQIFLAILCGVAFLVFGTESTASMGDLALPGFLIGALSVGFYSPKIWLNSAVSSRKQKLVDGFPDALDLMVVCVEAGLGLDQAIARVGMEVKAGHPDLGEEFLLLNLELRAGLSREQGLRNLVNRTNLDDIRSLVALLIQTDRFGTSVGQALRVHSDSMRLARRLRAEEKAAQLPVKLMIPLILFIFPSLMVVIIGPGVISLMRNLLPNL